MPKAGEAGSNDDTWQAAYPLKLWKGINMLNLRTYKELRGQAQSGALYLHCASDLQVCPAVIFHMLSSPGGRTQRLDPCNTRLLVLYHLQRHFCVYSWGRCSCSEHRLWKPSAPRVQHSSGSMHNRCQASANFLPHEQQLHSKKSDYSFMGLTQKHCSTHRSTFHAGDLDSKYTTL